MISCANKTQHKVTIDEAVIKVTETLKKENFGILLSVDFEKFRILGVCSPFSAYQGFQVGNNNGTLLPCNVIIGKNNDGAIEVTVIDPVSENDTQYNSSKNSTKLIKEKLKNAISQL